MNPFGEAQVSSGKEKPGIVSARTKIIFLIAVLARVIDCSILADGYADQQKLAAGRANFAFNLLRQLARERPGANIFISPFSAFTALQMVEDGAGGETKKEMQEVLGTSGIRPETLSEANREFEKSLSEGNSGGILTVANAIWYREGTPVHPEFLGRNREAFGATIEPLDFNDPKAIDVMNVWASEKTHGRISRIADGLIDPATKLFLANAVYFKEKWLVPFDLKKTKDRIFHLKGGGRKKPPMMEQSGHYSYQRGTDYQAVSLYYQSGNLSMCIFLPDVGSSVEKILGGLNGNEWHREARDGFGWRNGTILLPRFKIEHGTELKGALRVLGIKSAFSENADLSGISSATLYVSAVRQRAFVEVNEVGTEAAALTGILLAKAVGGPEPTPFEMIIDRPFFFLIEDTKSETILFIGLVRDPAVS